MLVQAITDHGVENSHQLAHAGRDNDFAAFAGGFEALGEWADDRISSYGDEGGHVECIADRCAAAADGSRAFETSAIAVEWCDTDQGTDVSSIDHAQFGQFGQEGGAEYDAEAGYGSDDIVHAAEVIVGVDQFAYALVERIDLFSQCFEHGVDCLAGLFRRCNITSIGLFGLRFAQLSSAGDQGVEFGLFFRVFLGQSGLDMLCEGDENLGVNGIGFGEDTQGLGKMTDAPRLNQGGGQVGIEKCVQQGAFVSSGGFDADVQRRVGELRFSHVASLSCECGRVRWGQRPCRLFGRSNTMPTWTMLCGGRGGPGHDRSWAGRHRRVAPRYARRPATMTWYNWTVV